MNNDSHDLSAIKPARRSVHKTKRIGRGRGSGHGDTATRGHKGAQSRSGYKRRAWFEGGQMPLQRRVPKRGFTSPNRVDFQEFNIGDLQRLEGEAVGPDQLRAARLVRKRGPIVALGGGDLTRKVNLSVHRITKSAREKLEKAGGSVEILAIPPDFLRVKKGPKPKPAKKPTAAR